MQQVLHHLITRHLLGHAGLKSDEAYSSAVTLMQRFGSAAQLNIYLHCLVLDCVYRPRAYSAPDSLKCRTKRTTPSRQCYTTSSPE